MIFNICAIIAIINIKMFKIDVVKTITQPQLKSLMMGFNPTILKLTGNCRFICSCHVSNKSLVASNYSSWSAS